jgi:A/G-specific adenine glycosylase
MPRTPSPPTHPPIQPAIHPATTPAVEPARLAEVRATVLDWFERGERDLPWRATRDPYRILVAEVVAQQTQADRAAAGWARFIETFPDVEALAAASPAEVLRAWQGLGYNRRALALLAAAKAVVASGGWPGTVDGLRALPGVGPYTARAVACFAFEQDAAPVDTNVARVLARSLMASDPADLGPAARQALADQALPAGSAWAWSSALMDIGAAHCRGRPRCDGCPLARAACAWHALGAAAPPARTRRQAPFASSDRRWRGAVVRVLAASPGGLDQAALASAVDAGARAGQPDGWFDALLERLAADGLVEAGADGRLRLPGGG